MNILHEGVKSWHDLIISLLIFLKSNFMMYSAWCVLKLNYSSSLVHERVLCLFWGATIGLVMSKVVLKAFCGVIDKFLS